MRYRGVCHCCCAVVSGLNSHHDRPFPHINNGVRECGELRKGVMAVLVELVIDTGHVGDAAADVLSQGVLTLMALCVTVSPVVYQIDQHLNL